jgi:hypothetical protein
MDASADFLSKLTTQFVLQSLSTSEPEYHLPELPDPELYDPTRLLAASRKHLAGKEITKDARNRIEVVARAIEQHIKQNR